MEEVNSRVRKAREIDVEEVDAAHDVEVVHYSSIV